MKPKYVFKILKEKIVLTEYSKNKIEKSKASFRNNEWVGENKEIFNILSALIESSLNTKKLKEGITYVYPSFEKRFKEYSFRGTSKIDLESTLYCTILYPFYDFKKSPKQNDNIFISSIEDKIPENPLIKEWWDEIESAINDSINKNWYSDFNYEFKNGKMNLEIPIKFSVEADYSYDSGSKYSADPGDPEEYDDNAEELGWDEIKYWEKDLKNNRILKKYEISNIKWDLERD